MAEDTCSGAHKIMNMDSEKRERLINVAMKEFCKGYKNASTDTIVHAAGISKGLLFHYFGTKQGLFDFLIRYAFDLIMREYIDLLNLKHDDLLDRIMQMLLLKMDLSFKYPAVFEFMTAAYVHSKQDIEDDFIEKFLSLQADVRPRIFSGYDESLFKDGIDPQKAANIVWWTLMGYSDSNIWGDTNLEYYQGEYGRYVDELREYFSILRKALYK